LVQEIKDAGISIIGDLNKLTSPAFIKAYQTVTTPILGSSFIRLLLVYENLQNLDALRSVKIIRKTAFDFLSAKHGKAKVLQELEKRGIRVVPNDSSISEDASKKPASKRGANQPQA
jgi:hypothetical protein